MQQETTLDSTNQLNDLFRVTLEKRDHAAIRAILVCLANPDFPA